MFIYLISGGFGRPDLVFSSYNKAQERVLKNIRSQNYCSGFMGEITARDLDYNNHEYKYKYTGECKDIGNIRFLSVNFNVTPYGDQVHVVKDVLIIYTVYDDRDLVCKQMEDYKDSSPKSIYYNDQKSIENHSKSYAIGKPKLVKDEEIKQYFKYTSFCHARANKE